MNRYIYRIESNNGKTYIGQRTYKGDNAKEDRYLGSSSWFKRNPDIDVIAFKEILIEHIKDDFTLSLLETVAIMDDIAERGHLDALGYFNGGNVNGNLGGYQHNTFYLNNMLGVKTRKEKGSYVMTEAAKQKMSRTKRENNAKLTPEERKRRFGHKWTEEQKLKMSQIKREQLAKMTPEEIKRKLGHRKKIRSKSCL